jgi:hypothetical protein
MQHNLAGLVAVLRTRSRHPRHCDTSYALNSASKPLHSAAETTTPPLSIIVHQCVFTIATNGIVLAFIDIFSGSSNA